MRSRVRVGMFVALAAVAAAGWWWWQRGAAFAPEPRADQNILLVTIDTLRADALSSYGGPAKTPALDALAARGARFTFAHAHVPLTLPSHTSILTGRLPYEHLVRDNGGFRVPDGTVTLATRLKAAGFATGAFVGGFPLTKRFGLTPGFDVYDDRIPELRGDTTMEMAQRRADEVVTSALAWMGQQHGKFFEWVHVFDAHSPYTPPPEYAAEYASQPYYGEVAFIDHALAPLFAALARLPRPTTVIVTADHGESLGEHGEATHGMFAYESTIRVPLIVATIVPGETRAPRGVVVGAPVRHIDIVPTVLDLLQLPADATLAGTSIRAAMGAGAAADRPSYFEAMSYNLVRGWAPLRGVIVARDKYIDLPIPELYHLDKDPGELANAAGAEPARLAALTETLRTYNTAAPNRPGEETADNRSRLAALGYATGTAAPKARYTEADDPKTLSSIDRDLHTASELSQSGRVDEAMTVLKGVIARKPETADAYLTLAYLQWQRGQAPAAIGTLESALRAHAPDRDIRIRLGLYLAESGIDPDKAIAILTGLPDTDVEALNGLGIAYADAGRHAEALATFHKVLALDPTNGLAFQNLASVTLQQAIGRNSKTPDLAKVKEAEAFARQALAADGTLAGAFTTLGVALQYQGNSADAIVSWQQAVKLDSGDFNALYNLWDALARSGRRDEAGKYGQQFLASAPAAAFASERAQIAAYLGK